MPLEVINKRLAGLADKSEAYQLQLSLNAIVDGIRAVLAIYDADAGVTATNAVATFDAIVLKS